MSNTPLAWLAGFGGGYLVFAAVWGRKPLNDLRGALTGSGNAPTQPLGSGPALSGPGGGGAAGSGAPSPAPSTSSSALGPVVAQSATVQIDTTVSMSPRMGYKINLSPAALRGFRAWEAAYGGRIPCTGGWRDCAQADAQHKAEPNRFASCEGSAHTRGIAVDVDNNWLGTLSPQQASRLRTAAKNTGWLQARWGGEANCGNNPNNDDERWHFSFGVCA